MSVQRVYLVISPDGSVRAGKRPRLGAGDVAVPINLRFSDRSRLLPEVNVDVPDFVPAVEVEDRGGAS